MYKVDDIVTIDNFMGITEKEYPIGWLEKGALYIVNQVDGAYLNIARCDSQESGFWIYEYNIIKASNRTHKVHRVNLIEI